MAARQESKNQGLWAITVPVKTHMAAGVVLAAVSGVLLIAGNVMLAQVVTIVAGGELAIFGLAFGFREAFWLLTGLIVLTYAIRGYSFIISHLGAFRLEEILRTDLTERLADMPLGYVISTGTGALKKVLLDDVKNLHAFVADSTPMIGKSVATPIASLVAMLLIDWRLALVAVGVLVLGMILMYAAMKDDATYRKQYEQSQSDINKAVIEFVQAMPVVRTFDDGTTSFKRYNLALERYRHHTKAWIELTALPGKIALIILSPLPTLLAVTAAGILFVTGGSLSLFGLMASLMVSTGMADTLMPLMWFNQALKKSNAAAERIQEIQGLPTLDKTEEPQIPERFDVTLEDVTFRYGEEDIYALKNVSFHVPENTTTALVGPSGAGKSTVARLIPRFWDVTEGSIRIGGVDVRDMTTETLMDTVSFVFQDTFLFNDTLAGNIRIAAPDASDEAVKAAAKAAQIHDFIMSLPHGYDTLAGDRGTNLSGGQKQRITIARAILRDAPVIVLDEATAFADPENEDEIVKALSNLLKQKTVIVIAHRLSTIKDVGQIVAFDHGEVTEKGRHDKLLALDGTYAALWKNYTLAQNWDVQHSGGAR